MRYIYAINCAPLVSGVAAGGDDDGQERGGVCMERGKWKRVGLYNRSQSKIRIAEQGQFAKL